MLTGYTTTGGPTFSLSSVNIDGLGRLKSANETITSTSGGPINHTCTYHYDMLSQLADATITNINGNPWAETYNYHKNGDMNYRTIQSSTTNFTYSGNQMNMATGGESFTLNWDNNGNMKNLPVNDTNALVYNWDNKLRSAQKGSNTISLKYDLSGNRIYKNSSSAGQRKYIVDVVGDLPVILMELDSSNNITKSYIYANSQILAQQDGSHTANRYFYLHDRLGNVREIINGSGSVVRHYTYSPFGETLENGGSFDNAFMFTGQYYDSEIGQYYLRARDYHPHIYRFTSRDIVTGQFDNPLSLHKYLYCQNEPINKIDPLGLLYMDINFTGSFGTVRGAAIGLTNCMTYGPWGAAGGLIGGAILGGFGGTAGGMFDYNTRKLHLYGGPAWSSSPMGGVTTSVGFGEGFDYGVNGGGQIDVDKLFGDYENILEQGVVGTWP
jgi:RHS repeat-associated protein